jgi:uncharacterized membrane protein YkoI
MNIARVRSKRIIIPTIALVAALGAGGVVWASAANADDAKTGEPDVERVLSDTERASAEKAALAAISGGTVTDVEAGDDGDAAYEVEVRDASNAEWDVELDAAYKVLRKTADD